MKPILIYSGGGNPTFYKIAVNSGFKYGARLPDTIYGNLFFADHDWRRPNREEYINAIRKYRPVMATVLDWEKEEQFIEVLDWAEEISQFVERILIVPKVIGGISRIPRRINGREIILAYSVPTKYGCTEVPLEQFAGWPIHLLGGSPNKQIDLWKYFSKICDVISIDGNYFRLKATRFCEYWTINGKWVPDNRKNINNAHRECFKKSCENIIKFWNNFYCNAL